MRIRVAIATLVVLTGCTTYERAPVLEAVPAEDCSDSTSDSGSGSESGAVVDCSEFALSESRVPQGQLSVTAQFVFEDQQGSVAAVRAFVTSPSGVLVEELDSTTPEGGSSDGGDTAADESTTGESAMPGEAADESTTSAMSDAEEGSTTDDDDTPPDEPGLACGFTVDTVNNVRTGNCLVTSARFVNELGGAESVAARWKGIQRNEVTLGFAADFDEVGTWTVEVEVETSSGLVSNRLVANLEVAADALPE